VVAAAAEAASKTRAGGSPLGAALAPAEGQEPQRQLLILDVQGQTAADLGRALELSPFEAEMRVRMGGLQLHRVGSEDEVRGEANRLEGQGLAVFLVPESEARRSVLLVSGGRSDGSVLHLRSDEGALEIASSDLLLIVRGPIRREYQAREVDRKKPHAASLEGGYRFHLHRRKDPRPLELDPASFAFGSQAPLTGSSLLELRSWLAVLGEGVAVDDAFQRLPPALGAAAAEGGLATLPGVRGGGATRRRSAATVLDNLAQFRFYSGWRAAIERRRASLTALSGLVLPSSRA
jgi:hypothetical protein